MDSSNQGLHFLNFTYIKNCIEWHGNEQISFQLSNFLFFVAFLIPHNASNQICDLLFRLLITTGCSVHVLWIVSIKDHCFFNYVISFWSIFLFINFVHSFHLTYKLSPASLPKKFTKLYDAMFEPIKLSKKEFKLLTQHSLVITINKGEHYLVENESPINTKVGILLEGKLNVTHGDLFFHQIYPNDFIDSAEFKYIEMYSECEHLLERQSDPMKREVECDQTCSNCRQVLIDMEIDSSMQRQATNQSINLTMNKIGDDKVNEKKLKNRLKSQPIRHQKHCALKRNRSNVRKSSNEINVQSINSPLREKHSELDTMNTLSKLSQVTITATENCKLLCWKRDLLVHDTLANNLRLRTIFHNLIGKDVINKLYLVNEQQRSKQQQIIGDESKSNQQTNLTSPPMVSATKLGHNPLRGDNLLSKFREINLLNSTPYLPHESMIYLAPFNRNIGMTGNILLNQDLFKQTFKSALNPYLTQHPPYYLNQAISTHPMMTSSSLNRQNAMDRDKQYQSIDERIY